MWTFFESSEGGLGLPIARPPARRAATRRPSHTSHRETTSAASAAASASVALGAACPATAAPRPHLPRVHVQWVEVSGMESPPLPPTLPPATPPTIHTDEQPDSSRQEEATPAPAFAAPMPDEAVAVSSVARSQSVSMHSPVLQPMPVMPATPPPLAEPTPAPAADDLAPMEEPTQSSQPAEFIVAPTQLTQSQGPLSQTLLLTPLTPSKMRADAATATTPSSTFVTQPPPPSAAPPVVFTMEDLLSDFSQSPGPAFRSPRPTATPAADAAGPQLEANRRRNNNRTALPLPGLSQTPTPTPAAASSADSTAPTPQPAAPAGNASNDMAIDEDLHQPAAAGEVPSDFVLGFTTGNKRPIPISEAALKQAESKRFFDADEPMADATAPDSHSKSSPHPPPPADAFRIPADFTLGFTTGRKKPIEISAAAMQAAQAKAAAMQADEEHKQLTHPAVEIPSDFQLGFQPGNKKRVDISAAALKKAEAMRAQIEAEDHPPAGQANEDAPMDTSADAASSAVTPTTDAAPSSTAPAPPSSVSDLPTTPSSKKRRSNFSTALPMPSQDEEDGLLSTPLDTPNQSQTPRSGSQHQLRSASKRTPRQLQMPPHPMPETPQAPPQPTLQTPVQALRPAAAATAVTLLPRLPHSAVAPPSAGSMAAPSSRKRGHAFVSPRVATKPPAALMPPTPAQTNLLAVHRNQQTNNGMVNGAASAPEAAAPSIASISVAPPLQFTSAGAVKKQTLCQFAAACQAKVAAMREAGIAPAALSWAQHTSIPVEYITSANAPLVLFLRPEDATPAVADGELPEASLGWLDARTTLLTLSADARPCPKLCSIAWVRNHYRWVVWKLAAYQRRFGAALEHPPCTFERVVQQLFARYQREFNRVKIPPLRSILEGDESPSKYLILMVAQVVGVKPLPAAVTGLPACASLVDDSSGTIPNRPGGCEVELSDGWYSIWCKLDQPLFQVIQRRKIFVGQKLRIWGAQLVGQTPTTPLENSETYFKIQFNSTRHAYWHAKLGLQPSHAFLVNFASIRRDGGHVPAIKVAVSRQYPMLFLHPSTAATTDTPTVTSAAPAATPQGSAENAAAVVPKPRKLHCNERAHDLRLRAFERISEQRVEKLQSEFLDRQLAPSKAAKTSEQAQEESDEWEQKRAELEADLQEIQKQVTPYLKLHLCEITDKPRPTADEDPSATVQQTWSGQCCMFTVWRPGDEHRELLIPGREFIIYGCTVYSPPGAGRPPPTQHAHRTAIADLPARPHERYIAAGANHLALSTSRMTNIVPYALRQAKGGTAPAALTSAHVPLRPEFLRTPIYLRPGELLSMPRGAEFDCVCVVLSVDEAHAWSSASSEDTKDFSQMKSSAVPPAGWSRTRQLLCAGMSGDLMFVEVEETDAVLHFAQLQAFQTPHLMVIENLQYRTFDKKLRLHSVASTSVSKFISKGAIEVGSAKAADWTHTVYQQPSIGLFQAWLAQPPTARLYDIILQQSQQIRDGTWNRQGVIISSFNTDEFKYLHCFDVVGHLQALDGPLSLASTSFCSLSSALQPIASLQPASASDEHSSSTGGSSLLGSAKKKSLLSVAKPAGAHAHTGAQDGAAIVADDCLTDAAGVCSHPSHTLSLVLDASRWSTLLLLDDGCRSWPLQPDAPAFRRLIDSSSAAEVAALADWITHMVTTGEVPHVDFDRTRMAQQLQLETALTQLRRQTCARIMNEFQIDPPRVKQQQADWIMVLLSSSFTADVSAFLDVASIASLLTGASSSLAIAPSTDSVADVSATSAGDHAMDGIQEHKSEASTEQQAIGGAELSPHQLSEIESRLRAWHHERSHPGLDPDGDDRMVGAHVDASPCFFFTTSEWLAFCRQVLVALSRSPVACRLAECERMAASAVHSKVELKDEKADGHTLESLTADSFKSVFIPKLDTIRRA